MEARKNLLPMKMGKLVRVMGLLVMCLLIFGCNDEETNSSGQSCPDGERWEIVDLLNDARSRGRFCGDVYYGAADPLEWDEDLAEAALSHSEDMAVNDFFGHIGSDGSTFTERVVGTDYPGIPMGENIAYGYTSDEDVVDGWLSSPGHCANIMNPDAKDVGVASVDCKWTMVTGYTEFE